MWKESRARPSDDPLSEGASRLRRADHAIWNSGWRVRPQRHRTCFPLDAANVTRVSVTRPAGTLQFLLRKGREAARMAARLSLSKVRTQEGGIMKKLLLSFAAIALLSAGFLGATNAHAQTCLQVGAKAGDQVRFDTGSVSAFWYQEMNLTVKSFIEFAELETNPGGTFCGMARVLISGNLVSGGMGQSEIILLADTLLKPGTRLHLDEFMLTGYPPACSEVGISDTCAWNGSLFRTATVINR